MMPTSMSNSSAAMSSAGPAESGNGNIGASGGQTIFKLDAGLIGGAVALLALFIFMSGRGKRK